MNEKKLLKSIRVGEFHDINMWLNSSTRADKEEMIKKR